MGKLLLAIVVGLVGAVLMHIAVIFIMPTVAENNAWGRLSGLGSIYEVVRVEPLRVEGPDRIAPPAGSQRTDFAFVDPAFIAASCRFSLADGPVRMFAAQSDAPFWSASIYDRRGDNLYSINDRSAVAGTFDLLVGTPQQIIDAADELGMDRESTSIPVEVNLVEGYMTIRVLVDEESKRPFIDAFVRSLACVPNQPVAANVATSQGG
ncbi:DUF1254 domain-containing protein [Aurantimonas aggregata]|uniref:DUF1254 domain-containing protein n=1 Tax=Aurantimonas aggregata TaxID=2047720 RepID=A0A6L9MIR7_9HYPH|nr:DUF1254 domain-containing protein [Aurantimonas aggregata]NDV87759.1 DUF1254 domain-containing protein [Aurantimonas aggregata]